jgi:hypothetical protein
MWRMVDYDGDGHDDMIVGVGDWTDYGWDNAYDAERVIGSEWSATRVHLLAAK